jgi:DNA primase
MAERIDWKAVRDTIDLAAVVTNLRGPAPVRRGARLYWHCPLGTHEDSNPSFCVEPGKAWWKCWGCGARGDAANLVMRLTPMTFPEAVAHLTGGPMPAPLGRTARGPTATGRLAAVPASPTIAAPPSLPGRGTDSKSLSPDAAWALVAEAEARLWSPEGARALAYLSGRRRCLSHKTIHSARLGWTPSAAGVPWQPPGIVVPWFDGGRLALVKVRTPDAWRTRFPRKRRPPKYIEAFRDRPGLYPVAGVVTPGRPLILAEGEFDALLLGQELGDLASVRTLGSASARPDADVLRALLPAPRWFLATDADGAGERATAAWPAPVRRVHPPGEHKDWTDARAGGVDLRRWWGDILSGDPDPARMLAALSAAAADPDEDGLEERAAIRAEGDEPIQSESRSGGTEEGGQR